MVLGLTATACGNDKTPNALSPSTSPAPVVPAVTAPGSSTSDSTVAPLPGAPPLVPATIPSSGVNPPGTYSGNVQSGSNDNSPPTRKKAQVKKVTEPASKVTYYDTPVKKPGSKPAKTVQKIDGEGLAEEAEKPKKLPTKPVKKPKDTSNDNSDEKEPAAKPAKPPKAEAEEAEGKKSKPAADAESKN